MGVINGKTPIETEKIIYGRNKRRYSKSNNPKIEDDNDFKRTINIRLNLESIIAIGMAISFYNKQEYGYLLATAIFMSLIHIITINKKIEEKE